jgi:chromatin assembly factor 1 subunit A
MAPVNDDPSASKSKVAGPKIAFPTSHLPQLLKLIDGNTKIRTDLISELRGHFEAVTSKAAIEAKVKEVAVRHGKAKDSQWKVKPEAWAAAGLPPVTGMLGLQTTLKTASVDSSTF